MMLVHTITSCGSLHGVSGCRRTWQPAMPQRAAWRSATVSQSTAQQAPPPADEYRGARGSSGLARASGDGAVDGITTQEVHAAALALGAT